MEQNGKPLRQPSSPVVCGISRSIPERSRSFRRLGCGRHPHRDYGLFEKGIGTDRLACRLGVARARELDKGMAKAIGFRAYLLSVSEKGKSKSLSFDSDALTAHFSKIVTDFVDDNNQPNSVEEMERTWFFEKDSMSKELNIFGTVHYGTYGFESNFKNNRTKALNYRRKTTDVEEIPLYFQFWVPGGKRYAFVIFQSFQGRSCVQMILDAFKQRFESTHPDLTLRARKLVPNDANGSIYNTAPVKRIRLIKKDTSSDLADVHAGRSNPESVDVELTVSARRSKSLGSLRAVSRALKHDGVLTYEGMEFDHAVAQIRVGGKLRPVGIFGDHSNAGVIDVSESIVFGADGHPTMESLKKNSKDILADFYNIVSSR